MTQIAIFFFILASLIFGCAPAKHGASYQTGRLSHASAYAPNDVDDTDSSPSQAPQVYHDPTPTAIHTPDVVFLDSRLTDLGLHEQLAPPTSGLLASVHDIEFHFQDPKQSGAEERQTLEIGLQLPSGQIKPLSFDLPQLPKGQSTITISRTAAQNDPDYVVQGTFSTDKTTNQVLGDLIVSSTQGSVRLLTKSYDAQVQVHVPTTASSAQTQQAQDLSHAQVQEMVVVDPASQQNQQNPQNLTSAKPPEGRAFYQVEVGSKDKPNTPSVTITGEQKLTGQNRTYPTNTKNNLPSGLKSTDLLGVSDDGFAFLLNYDDKKKTPTFLEISPKDESPLPIPPIPPQTPPPEHLPVPPIPPTASPSDQSLPLPPPAPPAATEPPIPLPPKYVPPPQYGPPASAKPEPTPGPARPLSPPRSQPPKPAPAAVAPPQQQSAAVSVWNFNVPSDADMMSKAFVRPVLDPTHTYTRQMINDFYNNAARLPGVTQKITDMATNHDKSYGYIFSHFLHSGLNLRSIFEGIGRTFDIDPSSLTLSLHEAPSFWIPDKGTTNVYSYQAITNPNSTASGPFQFLYMKDTPKPTFPLIMYPNGNGELPHAGDERIPFMTAACAFADYIVYLRKGGPFHFDLTLTILGFYQGEGTADHLVNNGYNKENESAISYRDFMKNINAYSLNYYVLENRKIVNADIRKYMDTAIALFVVSHNPGAFGFDIPEASNDTPPLDKLIPSHPIYDPVCRGIWEQVEPQIEQEIAKKDALRRSQTANALPR